MRLVQRKAVSTILGTLIFIGILFSAVIPMQLVMKQADSMFSSKQWEASQEDDKRDRESMEVYPIPSEDATHINVTLINKCEFRIDIVRVWINNSLTNITTSIETLGNIQIGPFPINPLNGSVFDIRAVSSRGNVYTAETGLLYYQNGEWVTETMGIRLIFPSRPGGGARDNDWKNELEVNITDSEGNVIYEDYKMYWAISASENFFELDASGEYQVIVEIKCKNPVEWRIIYDAPHEITWPLGGNPILEIKFMIEGTGEEAYLAVESI